MNADAESGSQPTLVVGPAWVGDMVMAQSLFSALKQQQPAAPIDVLAPGWSRPLLGRMPQVRDAIESPFAHGELGLRRRYRLGRALMRRGYGRAYVLPNSWKSALVPFWARIPRRIGYLGEQRWGLLTEPRKLDRAAATMTVQRFVALAHRYGEIPQRPDIVAPRLRVADESAAATGAALGVVDSMAPVLALCPGAEYGPSKRWPEDHFATLAQSKLDLNWRVWLLGSDKDAAVCAAINASCRQRCVDLAGRTSLDQVIDLLSLADLVVSNDSGLMHISAALDRPLVAIYGSTDPGFTPPLNARSEIACLRLECSPCFKRVCPLGHTNCLKQLTPELVLAAAAGLDR